MKKIIASLFFVLFIAPAFARSTPFCFGLAETYYEQLYCELKAQGKGKQLPDFYDFRNNTPNIQALLLKRPARKIGVEVVMPARKNKVSQQIRVDRAVIPNMSPLVVKGLSDCQMNIVSIDCGQTRYQFVGNRPNKELLSGVLAPNNRMKMPSPPSLRTTSGIHRYLLKAYQVYLQKMLEIGLGGATMSFCKFSYFFHDISSKGVSFNGRFETMFKYLKKDKQQIAVPASPKPNVEVNLSSCQKFSLTIIACFNSGKNYLFVKT